MSVQARVLETIQIGVEATPGTAVPATIKLASVSLEPQTEIDVEMYGPQGLVDDTIAIFNRERSSAALSGKPTFNELVYLNSAGLAEEAIQAVQYQEVDLAGATAGTFTLTFDSQETGTIDFDATAAEVQTALEALSNIRVGDVACTGGPLNTTPVNVVFIGEFLGVSEATMTIDDTGLTGGAPAVTPGESVAAFAWVWEPLSDDFDDVSPLTVESVGVTDSFRFTYGLINQLGINVSRAPGGNSIDLSGQMLGKPIDFGIGDATTGLSSIDLIPMTPLQFSCFLDTTSAANLGVTQFTDAFRANWVYGPKWQLKEALDQSEQSFTGHYVPDKIPSTLELQLQRNATAVALLSTLRAGGTVYFRLQGTGPELETGVNYLWRLDMACKLTNPNMGVQDGLSTITFTLNKAFDATWAKVLRLVMVNELSAL